jgi:hypothetical protein
MIETLLSSYESGACSRRQFLAVVSALLLVSCLGQAQTIAPYAAGGINSRDPQRQGFGPLT